MVKICDSLLKTIPNVEAFKKCFYFVICFWDRILLCNNLGVLGTPAVQADGELLHFFCPVFPSARIAHIGYHAYFILLANFIA